MKIVRSLRSQARMREANSIPDTRPSSARQPARCCLRTLVKVGSCSTRRAHFRLLRDGRAKLLTTPKLSI